MKIWELVTLLEYAEDYIKAVIAEDGRVETYQVKAKTKEALIEFIDEHLELVEKD